MLEEKIDTLLNARPNKNWDWAEDHAKDAIFKQCTLSHDSHSQCVDLDAESFSKIVQDPDLSHHIEYSSKNVYLNKIRSVI